MAYTNVWDDSQPLDTQAASQGAADFRQTKLDIMQRVASFGAGLLANRPTPEVTSATANWTGVMYWTTDTFQTFRWNGSSWDDITADLVSSTAIALATTGSPVNVSLAAPPTAGQVLTATDATHATWQTSLSVNRIISSAGHIQHTGDVFATVIYSGTVVANTLGTVGGIKLRFLVTLGGSGVTNITVQFGGVNAFQLNLAAGTYHFDILIQNINSASQAIDGYVLPVGAVVSASSTSPTFTTAVDTTTDESLQVIVTLPNGANTADFNNGLAVLT